MTAAARGFLKSGAMVLAGFALVVVLLLLFGNGTSDPVGEGPTRDAGDDRSAGALACEVITAGATLPAEVHETSGLARGIANPSLFWTHNDSGDDAVLYAIHESGGLAGAVSVDGARSVDWEDIESAPCPGGDGACLYVADTGDNDAKRDHVVVYVVPEPTSGEPSVRATALPARYPDGPRDAEGLFIVDGRIHIMTKGREGPIRVYRYPASAGMEAGAGTTAGAGARTGGAAVTLEPVADIAPRPATSADYVTAATTSPDGRWVAFRTYRELFVLAADDLAAGAPGEIRSFDLTGLSEMQGEGIVLDDDGTVSLTSEAARGAPPRWSRIVCGLDEGP